MNRKDSLTFSTPQKLILLLRGSRQPVSTGDLLMVLLRTTLSFSSPMLYWCFHSPVLLLVRSLAGSTYSPVSPGHGELSSLLFLSTVCFSSPFPPYSYILFFMFLYFIYLFISFSFLSFFLSFFLVISYIYIYICLSFVYIW